MKAVYCPYCGGRTKRNGRTSSGSQRWRRTACGASTTVRYGDTATRLDEFLGWLLSRDSQAAMPGGGRSFRRRTAEFWEVWPMPIPDGELHRVLYVDGIWIARDLVVLICCSGERVVSCYMARSENSRAWSALTAPNPATRRGRHRWRERVRQGRARDLAAHQGPEVHLPCLLAGQALHDDTAEAPGGARALRHRARPHGHRGAEPGRALGRAPHRLMRLLGRLPRGKNRQNNTTSKPYAKGRSNSK